MVSGLESYSDDPSLNPSVRSIKLFEKDDNKHSEAGFGPSVIY